MVEESKSPVQEGSLPGQESKMKGEGLEDEVVADVGANSQVEALKQKKTWLKDNEDSDNGSMELSEEEAETMGALSVAAASKSGNMQAVGQNFADVEMQAVMNTQLAHMKEHTYQRGYNPQVEETLKDATPQRQAEWNQQKQELLKKDRDMDHAASNITLSYKGAIVDHKLSQLRKAMIADDHALVIGEYYDKLPQMLNSPLYECLRLMPKPAVHHAHLTACASMDFLLELTYKDCVYYSQRANEFFVSAKGCQKEGFIKVNTLRQYWKEAHQFDEMLKAKMLCSPSPEERTDHAVWGGFQFKFQLTFQLYNYKPFFERVLYRVTRDFMREMVTVIEYKHILGCLFDDDGNTIPLQEELAIFDKCAKQIQQRYPLFRMRLIICGLKMFGKDHIQSQLDAIIEADQTTKLIVGFDMVNEEDYNPPIDDFLEQIMIVKMKLGDRFQLYLHAGESYQRSNTELYDAILLGSKRLGHAFQLIMHPDLIEVCKSENICIECCPASNKVLGYQYDLRTHPTRSLLANGVKVSLNPDDHGFFGSPGVTLDYMLAYMAWDLTICDLKQLCLNSIEFASISGEDKTALRSFFEYKWKIFMSYVRGKH